MPSGGGALPPAFMPAMPAASGPGSPGPIASLSSASLPRPEGHDPGRSATGNSLSGGGWGVDTPGIRTIVIKVRNDGAIIYQ
ncbi:hypothetical protein KAM333_34960 [Aeromonas caviae]|nr:hypothetical protein KAM333_34960 [Aeromonas caviae]